MIDSLLGVIVSMMVSAAACFKKADVKIGKLRTHALFEF